MVVVNESKAQEHGSPVSVIGVYDVRANAQVPKRIGDEDPTTHHRELKAVYAEELKTATAYQVAEASISNAKASITAALSSINNAEASITKAESSIANAKTASPDAEHVSKADDLDTVALVADGFKALANRFADVSVNVRSLLRKQGLDTGTDSHRIVASYRTDGNRVASFATEVKELKEELPGLELLMEVLHEKLKPLVDRAPHTGSAQYTNGNMASNWQDRPRIGLKHRLGKQSHGRGHGYSGGFGNNLHRNVPGNLSAENVVDQFPHSISPPVPPASPKDLPGESDNTNASHGLPANEDQNQLCPICRHSYQNTESLEHHLHFCLFATGGVAPSKDSWTGVASRIVADRIRSASSKSSQAKVAATKHQPHVQNDVLSRTSAPSPVLKTFLRASQPIPIPRRHNANTNVNAMCGSDATVSTFDIPSNWPGRLSEVYHSFVSDEIPDEEGVWTSSN